MKTVLICHEGADLDQIGLAHWMSSFSELAGILVLRENSGRMRQRIKREIKRVGLFRFFDVFAFRLYYKLRLAKKDHQWETEKLAELIEQYPAELESIPVCVTHSPNSPEAEAFLSECQPDVVIARCKTLLKPRIFNIPTQGTFVMHPGMCPEYRNAHGCFWALANNEPEKVAMTLLKIDEGIDTGPVYGYFTCDITDPKETHITIQHRTVLDNLDAIREQLTAIQAGTAKTIPITGRPSATWGQPWLTRYLRWKSQAKRRQKSHASELTAVS